MQEGKMPAEKALYWIAREIYKSLLNRPVDGIFKQAVINFFS
jgi:hypothetical protein